MLSTEMRKYIKDVIESELRVMVKGKYITSYDEMWHLDTWINRNSEPSEHLGYKLWLNPNLYLNIPLTDPEDIISYIKNIVPDQAISIEYDMSYRVV